MGVRDAFEKKLSAQIEQWKKELDEMEKQAQADEARAESEKAGAELQQETISRVKDLRARVDKARKQLEALQQSGDDAWQGLKSNAEKTPKDLQDAFSSGNSQGKQ